MNLAINSSSIANSTDFSQNTANNNGIQVDGNKISWPDNGWYEVQSATSYNTMSEGGTSAMMPHGTYNVINHTTGERFENITVGQDNQGGFQRSSLDTLSDLQSSTIPTLPTSEELRGTSPRPPLDISDLQPSTIPTLPTLGELTGGTSQRSSLGESDNNPTAAIGTVRVTGETIHWPNDGWYEVQYAESYNTLSEGGRSASPGPGVYNVINHTTGERFEGVVVSNDSQADNSYQSRSRSTSSPVENFSSGSARQSDNRQTFDNNATDDNSSTEFVSFYDSSGSGGRAPNNVEDSVESQTTRTTTTYPDTTPEDYRSDRNQDAAIISGVAIGGALISGGPVSIAGGLAAASLGAAGGILGHRLGSSETVTTTNEINLDGSVTSTQTGDTRLQDEGRDPLSSTITSTTEFDTGRQVRTTTNTLTGEQNTQDVDEYGVVTNTVSTADTSAASSPRTNRTTDEEGVVTETRTSPTGGTYGDTTASQNAGGGTDQQPAEPASQPSTTQSPRRDGNDLGSSDSDSTTGRSGSSSPSSGNRPEDNGYGRP